MAFHCWQAAFGSLSESWIFYSDIYLDISYLIEVLLLYSTGLCSGRRAGIHQTSLTKWRGRKNEDSAVFRSRLEVSTIIRKSWWPSWKNRVFIGSGRIISHINLHISSPLECLLCPYLDLPVLAKWPFRFSKWTTHLNKSRNQSLISLEGSVKPGVVSQQTACRPPHLLSKTISVSCLWYHCSYLPGWIPFIREKNKKS